MKFVYDRFWRICFGCVPPFSFLTNHGLTLLCIAEDPQVRMRDIAATVGITERAAQRLVSDLIEYGYVSRTRDGRRNSYTLRTDLPLGLPTQRDVDLSALLEVLVPDRPHGKLVAAG
jgi:hypothetical protein